MMNPMLSQQVSEISVSEDIALCVAAEVVLAMLSGRAPLRVVSADVSGVQYALEPEEAALQSNRALLEDVVMSLLAGTVVSGGAPNPVAERWLRRGLTQPEEQAVAAAYLEVLQARAAALIRRYWAEISVVAAGLREGNMSGEAVRWRMSCAASIRGRLIN